MNQKLVFLDIDGTIVANHREMSEKVKQAIRLAQKNGHKIFICTGRNKAGIRDELNQVHFDGIIASAGSYIEIDDQIIYRSYFSDEQVKKASEVFKQNNVLYNYECSDVTYMSTEMIKLFSGMENPSNSEMERLIAMHNEKFNAKDLDNYDGLGVHKISFIARDNLSVEKAKDILGHDFNFIIHELFNNQNVNGEIISKTDNKGTGIKRIVDYLNMKLEDTIGFGDSMNDYEMITTVNCGVVMANGSDELKKVADRICLSVEQDGVYDEFIKLGLI
ncbi:HAD family hydrolase [Thomasclavelia sp.]|uniref:HAD family hydrolase n=1 Tax=Thomasclavelia sp. TaxID=3025757 RepID=UPI0025EB43E5|nr:HAD family hydrolase [Thomasclavelia sp.]